MIFLIIFWTTLPSFMLASMRVETQPSSRSLKYMTVT